MEKIGIIVRLHSLSSVLIWSQQCVISDLSVLSALVTSIVSHQFHQTVNTKIKKK